MVRAALKEPLKAKAKAREVIYFRQSLWKDGVPQKQGGCPCAVTHACTRFSSAAAAGLHVAEVGWALSLASG